MSNEENFLLKWNNHQSNLVGVFKDWLIDESFVDVSLVCGGEVVLGHKVVLAACSPLLSSILHKNPCTHPIIILNDVPCLDMRALLKFIYHGEVNVSQSELPSFLKTADNLQIKGLAEGKEDKKKLDKKRKEKLEYPCMKKKARNENKAHSQNVIASIKRSKTCDLPNKFLKQKNQDGSQILDISTFSNLKEMHREKLDTSNESNESQESFAVKEEKVCGKIAGIKSEPAEYSQDVDEIWNEDSNPQLEASSPTTAVTNSSSCNFVDAANELSSSSGSFLPLALITESNDNLSLDNNEKQDGLELNASLLVEECKQRHPQDTSENHNIVNITDEYKEDQSYNTNSQSRFRGGRKACCFCGKTFCDNYTLRRHMVTHLARQRQFECSLCNAAYSRKDHLLAHVRRKHLTSEYEVDELAKSSEATHYLEKM